MGFSSGFKGLIRLHFASHWSLYVYFLHNFSHNVYLTKQHSLLIPEAARYKVWVCGRSLVGIAGSNLAGGMDACRVVWCQVDVSATGRSLVQRSPTECGVST